MVDLDNKPLTRDWTFEVYNGTDYIEVEGLTDITWSSETEEVDVTDFTDDGFMQRYAAQRSMSVDLTGYKYFDPALGTQDPGQARIEALAGAVGPATATAAATPEGSIGMFRYSFPRTGEFFTFSGYVDGPFWGGGMGGGLNDPNAWEASIMLSGTVTKTTP